MPVRSVLDVDVNDEAFRRFESMFQRYKDALDETPAAWRAAGEEITQTTTTIEAATNNIIRQTTVWRSLLVEQRKGTRELREQERSWGRIASSRSMAVNTAQAVTGLVGQGGGRGTIEHMITTLDNVLGRMPILESLTARNMVRMS